MDGSIILVLDYDKICRLCLDAKGAMSNIFDNLEEISLSDQIKQITDVTITIEDKLPQKICHKCRYMVEMSYELRDSVSRANRLLCDTTNTYSLDDIQKSSLRSEKDNDASAPELTDSTDRLSPSAEPYQSSQRVAVKRELAPDRTDLSLQALEDFQLDVKMEMVWGGEEDGADDGEWTPNGEKGLSDSESPVKRPETHKKHSAPKSLTCQICLTIFSSKAEVEDHVSMHYVDSCLTPYLDAKKPYRCEECNQSLVNRMYLLSHHRMHLNVNPFKCFEPGCEFVGKTKESLRHHGYAHASRTFVCDACGASFRRAFELRQHAVRHADEGTRFPCTRCRVVCRNRLSYRAHLKYHELGKRFKCPRLGCPKAYYSRNDLSVHERSHDNIRCYRCPLCVSSYVSQSQLNRHLRQHNKQRVNKCDKCSSSFDNYSAFYNHRVSAHGPWQPFKCKGCIQGYQSEKQLENHTSRCRLYQNLKCLLETQAGNDCEQPTDQQLEESAEQLKEEMESAEQPEPVETVQETERELEKLLAGGRPLVVKAGGIGDVQGRDGPMISSEGLLYIEIAEESEEDVDDPGEQYVVKDEYMVQ